MRASLIGSLVSPALPTNRMRPRERKRHHCDVRDVLCAQCMHHMLNTYYKDLKVRVHVLHVLFVTMTARMPAYFQSLITFRIHSFEIFSHALEQESPIQTLATETMFPPLLTFQTSPTDITLRRRRRRAGTSARARRRRRTRTRRRAATPRPRARAAPTPGTTSASARSDTSAAAPSVTAPVRKTAERHDGKFKET